MGVGVYTSVGSHMLARINTTHLTHSTFHLTNQVIRKIYTDLRLGGFETVEPLLVEATAKDAEFRRNAHPVRLLVLS